MLKVKNIILLVILTAALQADVGRTVTYYGPKKAAMGGCGVAVIDSRESLYYNPASVVYTKNGLTLPLIQSSTVIGVDVISNIQDLSDASSEADDDDTAASLEIYKKLIPSKLGIGYATSGHYIGTIGITSFGIGGYANGKIGANLLNRLSPRIEAIGYLDIVFPTVTLARPVTTSGNFFLKNIKLGFTVKNINRNSLYDDQDDSEIYKVEVLDLISEDAEPKLNVRSGQGVGFDLGMLADIDTFMGPGKLGISFQNISTKITGKAYSDVTSEDGNTVSNYSEDIPLLATIGFAVQSSPFNSIPVLRRIFPNATYAADFDFISQDISSVKRIHFGLEQLYLHDIIAWRMGLNQGYPTMGVNFNFGVFHIGAVYYTEEFGDEIGDNPQSFYVLDGGFYW